MSRFAPITADILARKGEARPWNDVGTDVAKQALVWEPIPPVVESRTKELRTPQLRKCCVRMSQHDYERLGILAVKQGKTRPRLLQEAVDQLFISMTKEYGPSCRCLGKCD